MPADVTAYFSQPTFTVDGQPNADLGLRVRSVLVEETSDGLYRCEARFDNWGPRNGRLGYLYFGRDVLEFGKKFAVTMGAGPGGGQVFEGLITALEAEYPPGGGAQIVVLAEDRLQRLRMQRRTRTFEDVSDEDIVRQIAQEHGLQPDLSLNGPTHRAVVQANQSDLAFLRERARSVGAEVWVEGDRLRVKPRGERSGPPVELRYGANLTSFVARADLAHQVTEVAVCGWDVQAKEAIDEAADKAAVAGELDGGASGSAVLGSALGERRERITAAAPTTAAQARSLAEAQYRERARRFVTGTGLADGDARIRVGALVKLSGLGSLFDGRYVVVRACHTYDLSNGFRTEFDVERPGLGPAEGASP